MGNEIIFYELSVKYIHETDWTYKFLEVDKRAFQVSPFTAYTSPEGELELSTVRVSSKEVLKLLERILRTHWKIRRILFLYPVNDGYPKILKLGVIGDLRDAVRSTAYTLGAIADSAIYFEGKEYWNFIFLQKYSIEAMKKFMEAHGKILDYKVREIVGEDVTSKYEFKSLAMFTPREVEILKLAYERGFFENPKKVSMDEIAKELRIAKPSANEILRKALKKVVKTVTRSFSNSEELD